MLKDQNEILYKNRSFQFGKLAHDTEDVLSYVFGVIVLPFANLALPTCHQDISKKAWTAD